MRVRRHALVLSALVFVAACQTRPDGTTINPFVVQGLFGRTYHPFFSPADHVEQLLKQGEVEMASQVWTHQAEPFFLGNERDPAVNMTRAVAASMSERLAASFERERSRIEAISWPQPRQAWPEVKARLAAADALREDVGRHRVLSVVTPSSAHASFLAAVDSKRMQLEADAPAHFSFDDVSFFESYPVTLDREAVLTATRDRWMPAMERLPAAGIQEFHARHSGAFDAASERELGRLHFRASLAALGGGAEHVLKAAHETRGAGLRIEPVERSGVHVAVVSATNSERAFLVGIDNDMPSSLGEESLDRVLENPAIAAADIVVLVDLRSAKAERREISRETVASDYEAYRREKINPELIRAMETLRHARFRLRQVRHAFERQLAGCRVDCSNPALYKHSGLPEAEVEYVMALGDFESTPETVSVPVHLAYQVTTLTVEVRKSASLAYYVLDKRKRTFREGALPVNVVGRLSLAQGVRDADRDRSRFARMDSETDVIALAHRTERVSASKLFEDIAAQQARPLPPLADIRRKIEMDRAATAIAR